MELFGSDASPFVRRIRLLLGDKSYTFTRVNIFEEEGLNKIKPFSKTRRIPILVTDDGNPIIDSWLICEYLLDRELSLDEKQDLVLVNEATLSGMTLFQMKKFELDPHHLNQYSKNQFNIVYSCLEHFEEKLQKQSKLPWELTGMWLYCTLNWFNFREVFDWESKFPNLVTFYKQNSGQPFVKETAP